VPGPIVPNGQPPTLFAHDLNLLCLPIFEQSEIIRGQVFHFTIVAFSWKEGFVRAQRKKLGGIFAAPPTLLCAILSLQAVPGENEYGYSN
jgi:hypothetical protein